MKTSTFNNQPNCLYLLFLIPLVMTFPSSAQWNQVGRSIVGEDFIDYSGEAIVMPDVKTIAISATTNEGNHGIGSGHVRIFHRSIGDWIQKGDDIDAEAAEDEFGVSVSMPDSSTIAVGANQNDGNGINSGHVRVFTWSNSAWFQKGFDIDGEAPYDHSGFSISMPDKDVVAIGAIYNDGSGTNSGHVRVYKWSGSEWIQKGLDIDGRSSDDMFGSAVSMPDTNTVAIGAPQEPFGTGSGYVRIYKWTGGAWVQKGLDLEGDSAQDEFGVSVSMPDNNTLAIGAHKNDGNGADAGRVKVYEWTGASWVQKGLDIDGSSADVFFGSAVSMPSADVIAIGAWRDDKIEPNAGEVKVFEWSGVEWVKKGTSIQGRSEGDYLGTAVSMPSENVLAVSAPGFDSGGFQGPDMGQVRIYNYSESTRIAENIAAEGFSFYPNPARESLVVLSEKIDNSKLRIIDVRGRILKEEVILSNRQSIKVSELNEGLYFVHYNGQSHKLIIQR